MQPCILHAFGYCIFGSACSNRHVTQESGPGWATNGVTASSSSIQAETMDSNEDHKTASNQELTIDNLQNLSLSSTETRTLESSEEQSLTSKEDPRLEEYDSSTFLHSEYHKQLSQNSRDFNGARVYFDCFGKVVGANLQSDFAGFQYEDPHYADTENIIWWSPDVTDFIVPYDQIHIDSPVGLDEGQPTTIRMKDSSLVQQVRENFIFLSKYANVKITPIPRSWQTAVSRRTVILSTVDITWKRYKSAVLYYCGPKHYNYALEARNAFAKRIRKRWVYPSLETTFDSCTSFLHLDNLDLRTTQEEICAFLPELLLPGGFQFISYESSFSNAEVSARVQKHLKSKGKLDSDNHLHFSSSPDSLVMRGSATYLDPRDAEAASGMFGMVSGSKPSRTAVEIQIAYRPTIKYEVMVSVLNAIEPQISKLFNMSDVRPERRPDLPSERLEFRRLQLEEFRLVSTSLKGLGELRKPVEALLEGTVIMSSGFILWHKMMLKPEFLEFLSQVSNEYQVHVLRDTPALQLRIYGGSSDIQRHVRTRILGWISEILTERDSSIAVTSLKDDIRSLKLTAETPECPVCFSELTRPIRLYCEHVYCEDCFINLAQFTNLDFLPLKCIVADCDYLLSIEELQNHLPGTVLEKFLHRSFRCWVSTNPNTIQNCATPDCKQIFRRTRFANTDICDSCLESYCSHCGATPFHKGLTCEQHKEEARGYKELQDWIAKQTYVKQCPSCTGPIEFTTGCNHMKCVCGEHFCWICLEKFGKDDASSRKTYNHMSSVHGGIGGGYVWDDELDAYMQDGLN